ncbi:MAG: efflux RND transporter periplasmic adaptor subunit [Alphaproteobacteria bacterium]
MSLVRQIGIVLLLLVAAAAGVHWFWDETGTDGADAATGGGPRPILVETAAAERTTLARKVEAVGTSRARQSIDIRPAASGRVVEIAFAPGRLVDEGDVLARLDATTEEADVAEARAERREAELALERAQALAERNNVAKATVEQLRAAFDAADARLQRAEKSLDERTIRAPFAGKVGLKQVDVGARVDDDTVLTTLDDLAQIEIDFKAPEIYFGAVSRGQKVEATGAAFDDRVFSGNIETIGSRVDPVSRAFQVRATLPNPDLALPAGMFMLVELTLAEREALTVPEQAVLLADQQASLFVIEDGKAILRQVELGQREIGRVEVKAGLKEGELVAVTGLQRLRSGAAVEVQEPHAPAAPADGSGGTDAGAGSA